MNMFGRAHLLISFLVIASQHCEGSIEVLNDANFQQLTSQGAWLIKFYVPWCTYSQKLAPIFEALTDKIDHHEINLGEVNGEKNPDTLSRCDISSYPTVKLIKEGFIYEYNGDFDDVPTLEGMIEFLSGGYKDAKREKLSIVNKAEDQTGVAEPVTIITNSNFDQLVATSKRPWLIKFFAPWCGHCKRMMPIWNQVGEKFLAEKSDTKIGKVDCTTDRKTCSRFSVSGYPSIFYIREGQIYPYSEPRTVDSFQKYAESGWKSVTATGPIPDITLASQIFDSILEFAAENMVIASLVGIALLTLFVAGFVALLDRCMGDERDVEDKRVDGIDKND